MKQAFRDAAVRGAMPYADARATGDLRYRAGIR